MQTIYLDLSKKEITPLLYAKQADVGRKFKVILSDGGAAYHVPAGATVSVWYSGSSGDGNYTDIGAESAISVSGNEIEVEMIAQMLANYGVGTVCIVLHTADGDQLGTWNIPYMVEPLPGHGSESAKAYFTAFSKAVADLPYPDASLSAAGKAADAAAVGSALANKAPAGYGLGYNASALTDTDLDTVRKNGWYRITSSCTNGPTSNDQVSTAVNAILEVSGSNESYVSEQTVHLGTSGQQGRKLRRFYNNASKTWQPWEWVNPPMVAGVEYRTTERWNGKAVYCKTVSFGALPNTASKEVAHNATIVDLVSDYFFGKSGSSVTSLRNYPGVTVAYTGGAKCYVTTTQDWTLWDDCYFILKYTKE